MRIRAQASALGKPHVAVALGLLIALPIEISTLAPADFSNLAQSESPAPQAPSTMPRLTGLRPGTKIVAVLQTTLDVLATKSGDDIASRVTKNLKRGGRIIVHEGDQLVGRVTSVRPQSVGKGQLDSEVAIAFDRLASGATTYRLDTVVHSVVWIPAQLGSKAGGQEEAQTTKGPMTPIRGARGPGGGRGIPGTGDVSERVHENPSSDGGYPRGGAAQGFIKARSRPAPDGRAGALSVLSDPQGNLRLGAGTRLDFRTQGK